MPLLTRDQKIGFHILYVLSMFLTIMLFAKLHPLAGPYQRPSAVPGFENFPWYGWTISVPTFLIYFSVMYIALLFALKNRFKWYDSIAWAISVVTTVGISLEWITNLMNIFIHSISFKTYDYSALVSISALGVILLMKKYKIHPRIDKITLMLLSTTTILYIWWGLGLFPHIPMNVLGYSDVNPNFFPWGWEDINVWLFAAYPTIIFNSLTISYIVMGVKT